MVLLENLDLPVDGAAALALAVVVGVLAAVGGGLQPDGAADALLAAAAVFAHDPHWLRLLANPFGILNETLLVKAIFEKYSLKGDAMHSNLSRDRNGPEKVTGSNFARGARH